ncbi:MAG: intradiol ring-cleavage dioxygenase [Saprospiraceae bacterium]|nr:intradiol ring-cleavage dioxygenase [Saprospiraceae bacterium]
MKMKGVNVFLFLSAVVLACQMKNDSGITILSLPTQKIGGGCDGCELMYKGMPVLINETDTSSGWNTISAQKLLITGTIYKRDGKTPAVNVILYYWHTDTKGFYSSEENNAVKAHGNLRGWVKTNENGKYSIYTSRPAPYPDGFSPAHIHLSVKEPDLSDEYYCEDVVFDDDPLLIPYLKKFSSHNRCGSGIVRILLDGIVHKGEHDIVLGLNIPSYPVTENYGGFTSGLEIGEDQPSFIPLHVFGPDKLTQTCPVCKYGRYHGIIFFADFPYDPIELSGWLKFLEAESAQRKKYLKVYVVFNLKNPTSEKKIIQQIEDLGKTLDLKYTALTIVPSWDDTHSEVHFNKINPKVKNTVIIYKHRSIVDKFINLKYVDESLAQIKKSLDFGIEWFDLPEIRGHE